MIRNKSTQSFKINSKSSNSCNNIFKKSHSTYRKNYEKVGFKKLNNNNININGIEFLRRSTKGNWHYYSCPSSRFNEHIKGQSENNCNA
jgi:hypothetical protein